MRRSTKSCHRKINLSWWISFGSWNKVVFFSLSVITEKGYFWFCLSLFFLNRMHQKRETRPSFLDRCDKHLVTSPHVFPQRLCDCDIKQKQARFERVPPPPSSPQETFVRSTSMSKAEGVGGCRGSLESSHGYAYSFRLFKDWPVHSCALTLH